MAKRTGEQSLPDPSNVGIVGAHRPLDPQGSRVFDVDADPTEVQADAPAEKPAAKAAPRKAAAKKAPAKKAAARKATAKKAAAKKAPSERIR